MISFDTLLFERISILVMTHSEINVPQLATSSVGSISPQVLEPDTAQTNGCLDQNTGLTIAKKSAAERKHVTRLDSTLLVYVSIAQILKYLDQQKYVAVA